MTNSPAQGRLSRWYVVLLLSALIAAVPPAARAQNEPRYFSQTGHYLRGAFRSFWERNGGLPIFGYPITEEYVRKSDRRIVQYFERARFELTVRNNQAIIDLGNLGSEVTGGRIFPQTPPAPSTAIRRYFPETGHSLQGEFKHVWERRGGVRIFGFPISEEIAEQLADGRWHTVQYFERARFELWPGRVLLGLLGRSLAPQQLLEPWPPNYPPPGPLSEEGQPRPPKRPPPPPPPTARPVPPPPPGDSSRLAILIHDGLGVRGDGSIVPLGAPPGTTFLFTASGFDPRERIGAWLTRPNGGGVEEVARQLITPDGRGNVSIAFGTADRREGLWTITAQGTATGRSVTAPFVLTHNYIAPTTTLRPPNRNGNVSPEQGGQQTVFRLSGAGFRANEVVEHWITAPDGIYAMAGTLRADSRGRIGVSPTLSVQFGPQHPAGVYGYHYRGTWSGVRVDLYLTFTG